MPQVSIDQFQYLGLKEIADKLHLDYYKVIQSCFKTAVTQLEELKQLDTSGSTAAYTVTCEELLQYIGKYLEERKDMLIPYVAALHDKQATGHNCATCSGGCDMGHLTHFAALQQSHRHLFELLHGLQCATPPLYAPAVFPAVYNKLRREMMLLDMIVRELLFVEEAYLMRGILNAQKKINVHS